MVVVWTPGVGAGLKRPARLPSLEAASMAWTPPSRHAQCRLGNRVVLLVERRLERAERAHPALEPLLLLDKIHPWHVVAWIEHPVRLHRRKPEEGGVDREGASALRVPVSNRSMFWYR